MSDVHQGHDHVTKSRERLVDTTSLLQNGDQEKIKGEGNVKIIKNQAHQLAVFINLDKVFRKREREREREREGPLI